MTARNTAPAVAVAALQVAAQDPDGLMLVLPADHVVLEQAAFRAAIDRAAAAAQTGCLVTFGITPDKPETGYGYIQQGDPLAGCDQVFQVSAFVEKPPLEQARRYVEGGRHFWNSGMFLFPVTPLLAELETHAPAVLAAARAALETGSRDLDFFRLGHNAFAAAPSISIDYAVMEKTKTASVAPCAIGWTDVGAWSALWEIAAKDSAGNVCLGDVIAEGTSNSYIRSEGALTAVVGLDGVTVVVTDDAVLVVDSDRAQDVKLVVERLKKADRPEPVEHSVVHRPWGSYQSVHGGERFQVKCLTVKPGGRLSLQKHHHRAEHWVVVQGTALVTRGEETIPVYENQSIYIPTGTVHRLENPGKIPLSIIEVQSGAYLGEDDIVRLEDSYGRE